VREAEKFRDEDKKQQDRITAKNKLEQYTYGIKSTVQDEKTKDKISSSDKASIESIIAETTKWVESNENASTEEFESKLKEVEAIAQPIIMKIYQAGGGPGAGAGGGMPDMDFGGAGGGAGGGHGHSGPTSGGSSGPKVEEVD